MNQGHYTPGQKAIQLIITDRLPSLQFSGTSLGFEVPDDVEGQGPGRGSRENEVPQKQMQVSLCLLKMEENVMKAIFQMKSAICSSP